jgi:hypothetical protein
MSTATPISAQPTPSDTQSNPATSTPQPSTLQKAANAAGEFGAGIVPGMVESMGDTIQSLPWVGKKILSPEAMTAERAYFAPGSAAEKYGQTTGHIAEPILEFVLGDEALKGVALADKLGIAGKIAKISQESPYIGKILQHGVNAARTGTVGTAEALAKGATLPQAVETGVATGLGTEAVNAVADAIPSAVGGAKQIVQGEKVAQPAVQQTVRQGVQAATENAGTADESLTANIKNQSLLGRNQTIVDQHLDALRGLEQDAYDRMDEAAGFDMKSEKAQLANDQYKIKQLGNTEADVAQKEKLTSSIQDSQARIADAEAKMKEAGIDPTEADALHKQRMAGGDFKKALIQATSSDGQTVNVNSLLNASKKLQFSKYGNRLEQFFGSPEAADQFVSGLEQAQKTGMSAAKVQQVAKWIGVKALYGAGFAAGADVIKSLVE